jgi:hypothetical protein
MLLYRALRLRLRFNRIQAVIESALLVASNLYFLRPPFVVSLNKLKMEIDV